ncbi:MAG: hypothetical protein V4686_00410 [Patescibacteria group bacterium]
MSKSRARVAQWINADGQSRFGVITVNGETARNLTRQTSSQPSAPRVLKGSPPMTTQQLNQLCASSGKGQWD